MRLEVLSPRGLGVETSAAEIKRGIGAAVVRAGPRSGVLLELGPADGPPHLRLVLSSAEASRLSATLQAVVANGGEAILLLDE
jgi:hypothetical protein